MTSPVSDALGLIEESLFHLRLDERAEAYHHRALAFLNSMKAKEEASDPIDYCPLSFGMAQDDQSPMKELQQLGQEFDADQSFADEVERLRTALRDLIQSCDRGPPMLHDGCGTTILGAPSPDALRKASAVLRGQ